VLFDKASFLEALTDCGAEPRGHVLPRKRAEERSRPKRPAKVARRPFERRPAFDRHDFYAGW
jgi:hypothetical protein